MINGYRERPIGGPERRTFLIAMDNIGQTAAEAMSNEPVVVMIGNTEYSIPRPTLRTMLKISAIIEKIPKVNIESTNLAAEVLMHGKYSELYADIFVELIFGSKKRYTIADLVKRYKLKNKLMDEYTYGHLYLAYQMIQVSVFQLKSFFALSTSLTASSVTSPTVERTTAHGQ